MKTTYVLGIILMIIISLIFIYFFNKKRTRKSELSEREIRKIKSRILNMSPREFEIFSSNLFETEGYRSIITSGSNDGGKDIILSKYGKKYYVECKRFKSTFVGRPIAQKLVGALIGDGISPKNGIIITSSNFTKGCREYCNKVGVQCWDLNYIISVILKQPDYKRKNLVNY